MTATQTREWLGRFVKLAQARRLMWDCTARLLCIVYSLPPLTSEIGSAYGLLISPTLSLWEKAMGNVRTVTCEYFQWAVEDLESFTLHYDLDSEETCVMLVYDARRVRGICADLMVEKVEIEIECPPDDLPVLLSHVNGQHYIS